MIFLNQNKMMSSFVLVKEFPQPNSDTQFLIWRKSSKYQMPEAIHTETLRITNRISAQIFSLHEVIEKKVHSQKLIN